MSIVATLIDQLSKRSTSRIQSRIAVSFSTFRFENCAPPALRPATCRSASTLRSVTGTSAGVPGSAKRSTMPKVPDENFASGGIGAVRADSGNRSALLSERPVMSRRPAGSSSVIAVCSGSGGLNDTVPTSSLWSSGSKVGASASCELRRRIASAFLREIGALKERVSGRSGVQGAFAFSRSHEKLAANGARTVKSKRRSVSFAMPLGLATPLPYTSCIFAPDGSACVHDSVSTRAASCFRPKWSSSALRASASAATTGMRLPMPAASHQMFASAERSSAGPFSFSTNTWRSSISREPGRTDTGNGPPVWNVKRRGPLAVVPATERSPSLSATAQRTPGGRSFSKS